MKNLKEKTLTISAMVFLCTALLLSFSVPNTVDARNPKGKKVNTKCSVSGVDCNNCDDGSGDCVDRTCKECRGDVIIE